MDVDNSSQLDQADVLDIGSLLVEARDNAGLTTDDIASALNLNNDVIAKIEQNIFLQELPIAFIRGYVKSYATKVGLEAHTVLLAFDKVTGAESPSLKRVESISSFGKKTREFNSNSSLFKIISTLIILLFVTFAGWQIWVRFLAPTFYGSDSRLNFSAGNNIDLSFGSTGEAETASEDASNLGIDNEQSSLGASLNDATASQSIPVVRKNEIQDQKISSKDSSAAMVVFSNITLDFTADCWVKIIDARGEILASGVKRDVKHMPVTGVLPISVILGDPSAVSLLFEDKIFDLEVYPAGRRVEFVLE
ncbi:MAG: DUF4115 domain-containing protein [Kangiellaceae bacterium]|nr:DUF4115 domain-containing protein [Kangiellaceae bacterium]